MPTLGQLTNPDTFRLSDFNEFEIFSNRNLCVSVFIRNIAMEKRWAYLDFSKGLLHP